MGMRQGAFKESQPLDDALSTMGRRKPRTVEEEKEELLPLDGCDQKAHLQAFMSHIEDFINDFEPQESDEDETAIALHSLGLAVDFDTVFNHLHESEEEEEEADEDDEDGEENDKEERADEEAGFSPECYTGEEGRAELSRSMKTSSDVSSHYGRNGVNEPMSRSRASTLQVADAFDVMQRAPRTYRVFTFVEDDTLNGCGTLVDAWRQVCNAVQKQMGFQECVLLKCVEKRVMLPYIYYTTFVTDEEVAEENQYFWVDTANSLVFGDKVRRQTGCFQELHRFVVSSDEPRASRSSHEMSPHYRRSSGSVSSNVGYIVTACKVLEDNDTKEFESMWKGWTGAGLIQATMPVEFGLARTTLFKRRSQDKTFMYTCIVECASILRPDLSVRVLQFIEKFKLALSCYAGLYRADGVRRAGDCESNCCSLPMDADVQLPSIC